MKIRYPGKPTSTMPGALSAGETFIRVKDGLLYMMCKATIENNFLLSSATPPGYTAVQLSDGALKIISGDEPISFKPGEFVCEP